MAILSLQAQVYRHLLEAIIRLDLAPGERLVENRLASRLGVSRLPVREALRQLEREQLVIVRPRRGAVVAPLTARDAAEIYTLRITLETLAARLAAENSGGDQIRAMEATIAAADLEIAASRYEAFFMAGARFHAQVVAASGNRKLMAVFETISHHVARLRTIQARSAPQTIVESAHATHQAICRAIASRQADRAARLMEEHIVIARDRIVPLLAPESAAMPEADQYHLDGWASGSALFPTNR